MHKYDFGLVWGDFFKAISINNKKIAFIIINIIVSSFGFIRSFVFMKVLNLTELGVLTIIQTLIMLISMMQFGLINGGYRIFSLNKRDDNERVNNLIFSYFVILAFFFVLVLLVLSFLELQFSFELIISAFGIGLITLLSIWITNTLIAKQLIFELNFLNLFTAIISLFALPFVFVYNITGAIIVLFIQPSLFVVMSLYRSKDLRPSYFVFNWNTILWILKYGFIPFIVSILGIITIQIERWSINGWLGTESLGKFYLVFLYSTLFVLVPNSINSLFFPDAMKFYSAKKYKLLKRNTFKYYSLLIGYLFITVIATIFLMPTIINHILPIHSQSINYVFYIIPGLCFMILIDPINLIFNACVKLYPMFWAYFSSILVYIILIVMCEKLDVFTLTSMSIIRSILSIYLFVFFLIAYLSLRKKIWI
jgi:O-antigen/teichoic acid export membrane protein